MARDPRPYTDRPKYTPPPREPQGNPRNVPCPAVDNPPARTPSTHRPYGTPGHQA